MHIYISGIGGAGLSALANLCLDLGYTVSGSDMQSNENTLNLELKGVKIAYAQTRENIEEINQKLKIDRFVHTPPVKKGHPEFDFCVENGILLGKQNFLVNFILEQNNLKLIAVSGTHGKTTTTSMLIWLFKKLALPVSYVVGTNLSFGNSGAYEKGSQFLIYEADEYDKKFLDLRPYISIITSLDYDHPDTYPTQADYFTSFEQFIKQTTDLVCMWQEDSVKLEMQQIGPKPKIYAPDDSIEPNVTYLNNIQLKGLHNRKNAFLAISALSFALRENSEKMGEIIGTFPGSQRRMEKVSENLYSDYAHHPVEIRATLQSVKEIATSNQKIVVIYQPHQNARQYEILQEYRDCFENADKIYWLPTYLTRENPNLPILKPEEIIANLIDSDKAVVAEMDDNLVQDIELELKAGHLVVFMGAGTIDQWARDSLLS